MRNIIEILSIPLFYGYTLIFQPLWDWIAALWLTRRWTLGKRSLLGWIVGLATLAGGFFSSLGWDPFPPLA